MRIGFGRHVTVLVLICIALDGIVAAQMLNSTELRTAKMVTNFHIGPAANLVNISLAEHNENDPYIRLAAECSAVPEVECGCNVPKKKIPVCLTGQDLICDLRTCTCGCITPPIINYPPMPAPIYDLTKKVSETTVDICFKHWGFAPGTKFTVRGGLHMSDKELFSMTKTLEDLKCPTGFQFDHLLPGETYWYEIYADQKRYYLVDPGFTTEGTLIGPYSMCDLKDLPSKFDWRNYLGRNWMTTAKSQDDCGSCWAFAVVGALEAKYQLDWKIDPSIDFSEQYLITKGKSGDCNGGNEEKALDEIRTEGLVKETCFPYKSVNCGDCSPSSCNCVCNLTCNPSCSSMTNHCSNPLTLDTLCNPSQRDMLYIYSFKKINPDPDDIKRAILCYGPLVVGSVEQAHAFVIVGWDNDMLFPDWPTKGGWIKKESRGIGYGDKGFGALPYDHPFTDFINEAYAITGVYMVKD